MDTLNSFTADVKYRHAGNVHLINSGVFDETSTNFRFICSNIPVASAYGVHLSVDPTFQSLWFLS